MNLAALIRILGEKGLTPADIAEVVEVSAVADGGQPTARQLRNQRYYESKRLKSSESKTDKTVSDVSDAIKTASDAAAQAASRTRVVVPSLPSLRSEELKPLTHPSDAFPKPKPPKPARSRLVPESWSPSPRLNGDLAAMGFTPGEIERELANFRDHEFRDPKSDFDRTFRKWMRTSQNLQSAKPPHERPHHDAKFEARQANLSRAFAGADRAAGRDWKP